MTGNNTNLDLVNMNAYIKFDENMSVCSQDIKWKRNSSLHKKIVEISTFNINSLRNHNIYCMSKLLLVFFNATLMCLPV